MAVAGVWNLLKKGEGVEKGKTFEDYEFRWPDGIPLAGRRVVLLFDSDTRTKGNLPLAVKYIRQHLAARGATSGSPVCRTGRMATKSGPTTTWWPTGRTPSGPSSRPPRTQAARKPPPEKGKTSKAEKSGKRKDPTGRRDPDGHRVPVRPVARPGGPGLCLGRPPHLPAQVQGVSHPPGGPVPPGVRWQGAERRGPGAAVLALEGIAVHDRPEHEAHVRVAEHGGRVYVHLANSSDTVIEIGPDGWRACEAPPVRFVRHKGMRALPTPRPGGRLEDLRRLINCPDDAPFALVRAWLAQALRAGGPFPLLVLLGEQGSAKSTTAGSSSRLLDPRALDVRAEPREVRDLMIAARTNWALAFDNLAHLPAWLSDALCRLATGGGFGTRELYSDDEEQTFTAKRPVILNGIEDFVTRPDLLERSLLIRHPAIPEDKRRPEADLWGEFVAPGPRPARGPVRLRGRRPAGAAERAAWAACPGWPTSPRSRWRARWAEAGPGTRSSRAYRENQAGANEQVLDDSPVAAALRQFMADKAEWIGTPTELLGHLSAQVGEKQRQDRDWPKKPNSLSNKLKRLAPSLRRAASIDVQVGVKDTDRNRTRQTVVRRLPDNPPDRPSAPSAGTRPREPEMAETAGDGPSGDRPPTARPSSGGDIPVQPESQPPDGPDGADDPSGPPSAPSPSTDAPVTPAGRRRRGRL